ncbi:ABC transporter permease [Streptomyces sp. SPB4]|uniref:ABC transporter permease n=1 Tax=Streptomyces sp. SPB4 TaxID=2940553 RepID=UPI00247402C4|nr:ABC transporter permease [Streptomyces sp. SPB4]MDH6544750.1 ABC-2 type transport system permease protein [Streptomyces sp. SPB4]
MTRTAPAHAPSAASAAGPPARFRDLLAAEWIKMRSLRSTWWTIALTALFVIGSAAVASLADHDGSASGPGARGFLPFDAFAPGAYMTLMLVSGSVGAVTLVSEYGSGLIRTTTVAVPARHAVVLAKAVVLAMVWTAVGAVISLAAFLVSRAVLDGRHAGVALTHPGVARALVASALLAPVCALVGLGLGALIRHTPGSVAATLFTLVMLPPLFSTSRQWSADVNHVMVVSAWKRLVQNWGDLPGTSLVHDATVPASWAVYAVWPSAAVALAVVVVRRRDV